MAKNVQNAHSWGGLDGGVWVTPFGVTVADVPTEPTGTPAADFGEVGWISDEGVTKARTRETETTRAWQGATIIRNIVTADDHTYTFQCLEENAVTYGLRLPGATSTTTGGITTTEVRPFNSQDLRSWVLDFEDGAIHKRVFAPLAEVSEFGDEVYSSSELTVYEFTVTVYPDSSGVYLYEITDNPALAITEETLALAG